MWHYEGAFGPEHWGDLGPAFAACRDGRSQSPIDLPSRAQAGQMPALALRFPPATLRIAHHEHVADGLNNGHTIQITYDDGDTLLVGTDAYALVQYHFHRPSEHTVAGRRFAMEMHLVHRSPSQRLAVVGVLIDHGPHNAAFDPIWTNLPAAKGVETHYAHVKVDVDALLPGTHAAYRYEGSLTTPPCAEDVDWFVLRQPVALGGDQIDRFAAVVPENSRPLQPLNGRSVVADEVR